MSDERDWFDGMVAASKEAAGLPSDWGIAPSPLSPEEEMEDAVRPPRLRAGMTTAELLPYGEVVRTADGQELAVERLTAGPLEAPDGGIAVCDPVSLEWLGQPLQLGLRGMPCRWTSRCCGARRREGTCCRERWPWSGTPPR